GLLAFVVGMAEQGPSVAMVVAVPVDAALGYFGTEAVVGVEGALESVEGAAGSIQRVVDGFAPPGTPPTDALSEIERQIICDDAAIGLGWAIHPPTGYCTTAVAG